MTEEQLKALTKVRSQLDQEYFSVVMLHDQGQYDRVFEFVTLLFPELRDEDYTELLREFDLDTHKYSFICDCSNQYYAEFERKRSQTHDGKKMGFETVFLKALKAELPVLSEDIVSSLEFWPNKETAEKTAGLRKKLLEKMRSLSRFSSVKRFAEVTSLFTSALKSLEDNDDVDFVTANFEYLNKYLDGVVDQARASTDFERQLKKSEFLERYEIRICFISLSHAIAKLENISDINAEMTLEAAGRLLIPIIEKLSTSAPVQLHRYNEECCILMGFCLKIAILMHSLADGYEHVNCWAECFDRDFDLVSRVENIILSYLKQLCVGCSVEQCVTENPLITELLRASTLDEIVGVISKMDVDSDDGEILKVKTAISLVLQLDGFDWSQTLKLFGGFAEAFAVEPCETRSRASTGSTTVGVLAILKSLTPGRAKQAKVTQREVGSDYLKTGAGIVDQTKDDFLNDLDIESFLMDPTGRNLDDNELGTNQPNSKGTFWGSTPWDRACMSSSRRRLEFSDGEMGLNSFDSEQASKGPS